MVVANLWMVPMVLGIVAVGLFLRRRTGPGGGVHRARIETIPPGWISYGVPAGSRSLVKSSSRHHRDIETFSTSASSPPPPDPIIDLRADRSILSALLTAPTPLQRQPVERLVTSFARNRPVTPADGSRTTSSTPGFTVLLDRGEAMIPFATDLRRIELAVQSRFPGPRNRILSFLDHPWNGVGTESSNLQPLTRRFLPEAGGTVLIVSDLDAAAVTGRRDSSGWVALDRWLRSFGLVSLFLVPSRRHGRSRYPDSLAVIEWDSLLSSRAPTQHRRARRRTPNRHGAEAARQSFVASNS